MEPQELGTDMAALIEIGAANEADIPVLGQLASKAFAEIPLDYIGYKAHRRGIESVKLFTNVAREDMADPASHIFRATNKSNGEIVGYGAVTFVDPKRKEKRPGPCGKESIDVNPEFAKLFYGQLEAKYQQHMDGKKHVVWSSLYVLPLYQGRGIGRQLLDWGFTNFEIGRYPIWLSTTARARLFYLKYGWEDVDHVDIDLAKWTVPLSGFGMHRTPCMIRKPTS